ncbi:hypothetical protein N7532_004465 [Penicillium argentinense]|uniref:Uncharacterized protein n=1 Tax=Penicillium argentinense TaxID=1131581 RepID=A0A9W9KFJ7_9EURO|nr:uncharacterized protein N7532_004465 [Penicillium argentinense]KAJ5103936.1 hypothetical protein N7532_004465 [Penicillium argentinense]
MTASTPNSSNGYSASPLRPPLFVAQQPVGENGYPVIQKVLIANRGEIACRIIRTCRKLSITSVAIYVDEDFTSRHVTEADESINIGSLEKAPRNPFLDIELLVQTAVSAGVQAVHPGYGYLSENADFANRIREADLIFIGPSASAMSTLGDKRSSKTYLREHAPDVPLIPGFAGSSQNPDALRRAAEEIGFPIMVKASAGGGGKGMRVVRESSQLKDELARAQSEARRSFGSSDCILEKYIEDSKHVEIQVLGDSHGEVVSFFDRDCSVQRRHQKVIEETPCPFLTDETRQKMINAAVRIAKLIEYENAGTVEFILDVATDRFYFLEVNARLQVEHPITEEVTGVDLVSLQLFVAAGGSIRDLPAVLNSKIEGHAIECRLTAESPERNFFPEHGQVHLWRPAPGVFSPDEISAIEKMRKVLAETACVGVKTNQLFLQSCLLSQNFRDPAYTTSFIPANLELLLKPPSICEDTHTKAMLSIIPSLAVRRLADFLPTSFKRKPFHSVRKQFRNQRYDPVSAHCDIITPMSWQDGGKENRKTTSSLCLWKPAHSGSPAGTDEVQVWSVPEEDVSQKDLRRAAAQVSAKYNMISQEIREIRRGKYTTSGSYKIHIKSWQPAEGSPALANSWLTSTMEVIVNGKSATAHVCIPSAQAYTLAGQVDRSQHILCHFPTMGTWLEFERDTLLSFARRMRSVAKSNNDSENTTVIAPMPCKILSILKKNGDDVKVDESVMIIESMKMEIVIRMSASGKFETKWKEGDAVEEGKVLCSVV